MVARGALVRVVQDEHLKASIPLGKGARHRPDNELLASMRRNDNGNVEVFQNSAVIAANRRGRETVSTSGSAFFFPL